MTRAADFSTPHPSSAPAPGRQHPHAASSREESLTFFGSMPQWVKITGFLGFPCAACAAMGSAMCVGLLWIGNNLVIPIRDSVIKTHDRIATAVELQTANNVEQKQISAGILTELRQLVAHLPRHEDPDGK